MSRIEKVKEDTSKDEPVMVGHHFSVNACASSSGYLMCSGYLIYRAISHPCRCGSCTGDGRRLAVTPVVVAAACHIIDTATAK